MSCFACKHLEKCPYEKIDASSCDNPFMIIRGANVPRNCHEILDRRDNENDKTSSEVR